MITHKTQNKTEYWVYNDNPKLPVIILIHGLRGTHHGLDLVAKQLGGYRVIVPDLPGFGITKPLNDIHSLGNYVKWLNDFITNLKLPEAPFLLGHSFGSIIVASYAKEYPDSIKKLILVNPIGTPALEGPKRLLSQLAVAYYWLGNNLPEAIGVRLLAAKPIVMITSLQLTKTPDKTLRKYIHSQHLEYFSTYSNRKVLNEAFTTSVTNNVSESAHDVKTPTLIIAGELDDITSVSDQHKLNKLFSHSKIIVIKRVGHLTQYESPEQVAKAIKEFTN